MIRHKAQDHQGSIIISILIISMFLSTLVLAMIVYANSNLTRGKGRVLNLEAQYAAESGADSAIAFLNNDPNAAYTGTGASQVVVLSNTMYKATYST
jgi:type II secretory pathway component PulK